MSRSMSDFTSELPRANRRVTTVLIADLVGYTSLTEQLDPEDLERVMKRLIEGERLIVTERYDGMIFGSDGDDVKALFGDPVAHEDDPCRAVRCAFELQQFARQVQQEFPQLQDYPLQLHAGICTGVVITKGGDRGGYGPTGDAINTAARLVNVAKAGEIVVETTTHRAIASVFDTELVGSVPLKGKQDPVDVYRVLRPIPRGWFELARERGLGPFVGRASALSVLEATLQRACDGHGGFVAVSGEPGVGKTRLLFELRQRIPQAVRVVLVECDAAPTVSSFHPVIVFIREVLGLVAGDTPDIQRAVVAASATELDPGLDEYVPIFLQLLSLRKDDTPLPSHLRDERLARAIQDGVSMLATAAARQHPLVLLLEDWHLADEASRAAMSELIEDGSSRGILVVLTYRSEWTPEWQGEAPAEIRLSPLRLDDARKVIAARLHEDAPSETLVQRLYQHTGGNPLFLDEICRVLKESGVRTGSARELDEIEIPGTVQAVIRARIDRLEPRLRRMLRIASVLGLFFPTNLLAKLAEEGETNVDVMLGELQRLDLVGEEKLADRTEPRYRFKHAITREVAYASLLLEDRRELHRRAGAAIEALYSAERLAEHDEIVADHYERGGQLERAAEFARRAGDKAAASFALGAARAWYRRAIGILDALGEKPDAVRERIDVSGRWAEACVYDPAAAEGTVLERSYELAEKSKDHRRAARAVYWMGWFEHAHGNHHKATRHFERAFELVEEMKDGRLVPQLQANLGQTAYHRGELALAESRLERAIVSDGRTIITANALGYLALIDAEHGRFSVANERVELALQIVRELEQRQLEGSILTIAAYVAMFQGYWESCIDRAEQMRDIAATIDAPYILAMSKTAAGYARWFLSGDRGAFAAMREAIGELETSGSKLSMSVNYACLAEVMALAGEAVEARQLAEKARDRATAGDRVGEIQAHRALGIAEMRTEHPRIAAARARFEEGIALAVARRSQREAALTRWRLAEVLVQSGENAEARRLLTTVNRAFQNCSMPWHLEQVRALRASIPK